jgi:hypothetical protein
VKAGLNLDDKGLLLQEKAWHCHHCLQFLPACEQLQIGFDCLTNF